MLGELRVIDKDLLNLLRCPLSGAPLVLDGDRLVSRCQHTRRAYAIHDGIPVMLIDEATELTPEEHRDTLEHHGVKPTRKKAMS